MGFQIENNANTVTINTANGALDGSGTIAQSFIANGTYGSVLQTIRIQSTGSTSAGGMVRFFRKPVSGSFELIKEVPIPETVANDPPYPVFATTLDVNLKLKQNDEIGVSTENADTFKVSAFGYDITGFI